MSKLEIFDCEQGSSEWYAVRLGMPTASEFACLLMSGRGGGESKTRRTYLYKLAGERITGEPMESYSNKYMERGKKYEPEARDYYTLITDRPVRRVGFIKNAQKGCSPDGLIETHGMLEVKTEAPHLLIDTIENETVEKDHYAQLQGNLWVAERDWIDLLTYYPKMPASLRRVYRDDSYIKTLEAAVDKFNEELDALVERIKAR
jgi:YqaJ-like viral recombinase domain